MNNIIGLYTGMDGRIGRQQWWIGVVILAVIALVLNWILGAIFGAQISINYADLGKPEVMAALQGTLQKAAWVSLITTIIIAYPYIALSVKRRHDKDNNGMDVIGLFALQIIVAILGGLGATQNILGTILSIVVGVYAIYLLVVLGFLKGTTGPNQYGADPLGGA